ncbi:hypothetical protein K439DRAFT_1637834 [Ramaria rubella]|nr:hypothetical protein K439DRAFT_1637834 [Ramaria rubella]
MCYRDARCSPRRLNLQTYPCLCSASTKNTPLILHNPSKATEPGMDPSAEDTEDQGRFSESTKTRDPSLYASPGTLLEYEHHYTRPASQPYISHQRAVKNPSKEDQRRLLRQSALLSTHYRSLDRHLFHPSA